MKDKKNKIVKGKVSHWKSMKQFAFCTQEDIYYIDISHNEVLPRDELYAIVGRSKRRNLVKSAHEIVSEWKRFMPFCQYHGICGGCSLQYLDYKSQLMLKEKLVKELLSSYEEVQHDEMGGIIGCKDTVYYRNRVDYTFGAVRWLNYENIKNRELETTKSTEIDMRGAGFHVKGKYDKVIHLTHCFLHHSNGIRKCIHNWAVQNNIQYYNAREKTGFLRMCTVRTSLTNEIMVIIHIAYEDEIIYDLCTSLRNMHPEISSLYVVVNSGDNDTVQNLPHKHVFGAQCIIERCGHLQLRIYPKVFYQTNSVQAECLYSTIAHMAEFKDDDVILDLYCGIGSIGLYLAKYVKNVVGIDILEESINNAIENASHNGIKNAIFFAVASEHAFNTSKYSNASKLRKALDDASIVIVDPPRVGLHKKVKEYLCESMVEKIIYTSCNPHTLAHDIADMNSVYRVNKWKAVDMFPQTMHIETVVQLLRR